MSYTGKISTSGTSEAIRFEKNLFKQHPEFKQQAIVKADVISPGKLLVSLVDSNIQSKEDPLFESFLAFLQEDMAKNPGNITELNAKQISYAKKLTKNVIVSDKDLD